MTLLRKAIETTGKSMIKSETLHVNTTRSFLCMRHFSSCTSRRQEEQVETTSNTPKLRVGRFIPREWTAERIEAQKQVLREERKLKRKTIKIYATPPGSLVPKILEEVTSSELKKLDPTGTRTRLFSRKNKDAIKPGDIVQIRFKNPSIEPFAGVLINIRRRGLDSGVLLRNHLTRVGVEMWYKIYSPLIEGFDLVQRAQKRARRAKLYYMRKPKHDMGSVENIVKQWQKSRMTFTTSKQQQQAKAGTAGKDSKYQKKQYKSTMNW